MISTVKPTGLWINTCELRLKTAGHVSDSTLPPKGTRSFFHFGERKVRSCLF